MKTEIIITETPEAYTFSRLNGHNKKEFIVQFQKRYITLLHAKKIFESVYVKGKIGYKDDGENKH